jgi:IS30 family transposase
MNDIKLREQIYDIISADLPKSTTLKQVDMILKLIEKRIDSISYDRGMEYHCCASVDSAKKKMKELLK